MVSSLLDAGSLPNLNSIVERGALARLIPLLPAFDAAQYASAVTGVQADRHGILTSEDINPRDGKLCSPLSIRLRSKPVGQILGDQGVRTIAVGCPLLYPVTEFRGAAVCRRIFSGMNYPGQPWVPSPNTICGIDWTADLRDICLRPEELTSAEIEPFVPDLAGIDQKRDPTVRKVAIEVSQTASLHAIATSLMQTEEWRFAALAPSLIRAAQSKLRRSEVSLQRTLLQTSYAFSDQMLGKTVKVAGSNALIAVCSAGWMCMAGPGTRQDVLLHNVSALHIAPTILYALGCPVPSEMYPPLTNGFEDVRAFERTYNALTLTPEAESAERAGPLKALGYRDPIEEKIQAHEGRLKRERALNLAAVYLGTNRFKESVEVLENGLAGHQRDTDTSLTLCYTYLLAGRIAECRELMADIPETQETRPIIAAVRAYLAIRHEQSHDALSLVCEAELYDPGNLPLLSHVIGCLYLDLNEYRAAERVFRRTTERFPDYWPAHDGHAKALRAVGRLTEAAEAQRRSLNANFASADSHTRLAFLLLGLGDHDRAVQAFRTAAELT